MTTQAWGAFVAVVGLCISCGSIEAPSEDASTAIDAGGGGTPDAPLANPDAGIPAPRLTNVDAPLVPGGGDGIVRFTFVGQPDESVTTVLTAGSGTFAPETDSVVLDPAGVGMWQTTFTAPNVSGQTSHQLRLTDSRGASENNVFTIDVTASLIRVGNSTPFLDTADFAPNFLLGKRFSTTQPARLLRIGVIESAAGAQVVLALYSNLTTNRPGTLLAATAPTTLAVGANEIPVITPADLPVGSYWIMGVYNVTSPGHQQTNLASETVYVSHPFTNALPNPYPAIPNVYSGGALNYYMVLQP